MNVDTTRLRFGDLIAGGSAVLLFLFMFMTWYKVEDSSGDDIPDAFKDLASFNAWESFGFLDILLFLIILAVIAIVVIRLVGVQLPPLPVPLGTILLALGALAAFLILLRLIITPNPAIEVLGQEVHAEDGDGEVKRSIGVFLGFLAALGMAAGGFLSMKERGEDIPGVGPLGAGGPAGGPLGGGQPAAGGYGGQPAGGQPAGGYGGQPAGGQEPAGGGYAQPAGGQPAAGAGAAAAGAADPGAAAGGNPPADWYDDPRGEARLRYWDGHQWTDQTAQ
jgi:hypothetical protein